MFKDFYNLKSDPFGTHPDPEINFISRTHKEAWFFLLVGIQSQEPFVVLTGEYGMGKTLLSLRLFQYLKNEGLFPTEYIPTPYEDYLGILRRVAVNLGISPIPDDENILLEIIYDWFRSDSRHTRFCLIIDDSHELGTTTLTKLKQFSTFSHNGFFPFIIIFFAHPSFLKDLKNPALISLNQRIKRRYNLSRFGFAETKEYIYFRLLKSGSSGIPAFSEESLVKIFEYSGGVPRVINNICDMSLLIGASRELTTISQDVVDVAIKMVEGAPEDNEISMGSVHIPAMKTDMIHPVRTCIAISENIQDENRHFQDQRNEKKSRNISLVVMIAIMLILLGFTVYKFFMKDIPIAELLPSPEFRIVQKIPPDPINLQSSEKDSEKTSHQKIISLPVKEMNEAPTLREESVANASAETSKSASQTDNGNSDSMRPQSSDRQNESLTLSQESVVDPSAETSNAVSQNNTRKEEFFATQFYPFSIRYASYHRPNQAAAAIAKTLELGLIPYMVKVTSDDSRIWWRMYVGFYATREEARSIIDTYKLHNAFVQKTEYACQVIDVSNDTDIQSMSNKLKQSGYYPYVFQRDANTRALYLGAYEKKSEAENLRRLLLKNDINCLVVKR